MVLILSFLLYGKIVAVVGETSFGSRFSSFSSSSSIILCVRSVVGSMRDCLKRLDNLRRARF